MSIISKWWRALWAWDGWYMFPWGMPTPRPTLWDLAPWERHLKRRIRQHIRERQRRQHTRLFHAMTAQPSTLTTSQPMTTVTLCTTCVQDESVLNRVL